MAYLKNITLKGRLMEFPIYFPDATRAVIRTLDSQDLRSAGVEGVVTNTYHLMTQPGTTVIGQHGGLHKFMGWDGWITTDSGGFQVMSMLQGNPHLGKITDDGIVFYQGSQGKRQKYQFTPEKSIQVQFKLGADIMVCLDEFTNPRAGQNEAEISVNRTTAWAKRCRDEFDRLVKQHKMTDTTRPILIGVIQGGRDKKLRARSARELMKIGFDGYGLGGWPIDENGKLDIELVKFNADLTPDSLVKFALGIGNPQDIIECFKMGYTIFDCVLPTRDARHQRLYTFRHDPDHVDLLSVDQINKYLYILREPYVRDQRPISEHCDCHTCQHYSRAYLHHLFRIKDATAGRLATIHNLRMYTRLIEKLRSFAY